MLIHGSASFCRPACRGGSVIVITCRSPRKSHPARAEAELVGRLRRLGIVNGGFVVGQQHVACPSWSAAQQVPNHRSTKGRRCFRRLEGGCRGGSPQLRFGL